MKNIIRLLGALTAHGLITAHDILVETLGMRTSQHYEFHPFTPWAELPDSWFPEITKYYYDDPQEGVWCIQVSKVLVWGPWTVLVEYAEHGGGITRFFRTDNRVWNDRALALQHQWDHPSREEDEVV